MEGYSLPQGDGSERNRANLAKAADLLNAAGWTVQDGVLKNAAGEPFAFELLLRQGQVENTTIANLYIEALKRLGIEATVNIIDSAQYTERTDSFDFDMTYYRRGLSLSPGNEQYAYWGSDSADNPGSRNWMGVKNPAIDAMIDRLLNSESQEDFRAATKALDRLLTAGRYVVPFYEFNISRLAHAKELKHPEYIPIYGDWIEWQPDVWYWLDE